MREDGEVSAFADWSKAYCELISPAELLNHTKQAYCPTKEDMEEYAAAYEDLFLYEEPLLLSRDRKILYGYSAEDLTKLVIPDEVEIYDNICCHTEDEGYEYYVEIGSGLKQIVDTYECFGYHNIGFSVSNDNPYFSAVEEILYDKEEKTLICYPSGRTTEFDELEDDSERCYVTLPNSTVKINRNAFCMLLLPITLEILDSVEIIESGAFIEMFDKGFWMSKEDVKARRIILPERFQEVIDKTWKEDSYNRPTIKYY